jgi:uncharacterized protein with von Willebrand factor type A (vWA) domain
MVGVLETQLVLQRRRGHSNDGSHPNIRDTPRLTVRTQQAILDPKYQHPRTQPQILRRNKAKQNREREGGVKRDRKKRLQEGMRKGGERRDYILHVPNRSQNYMVDFFHLSGSVRPGGLGSVVKAHWGRALVLG